MCLTSIVDVVGSTTEPLTREGCLTRLVYIYVKLNKHYKTNPSPLLYPLQDIIMATYVSEL